MGHRETGGRVVLRRPPAIPCPTMLYFPAASGWWARVSVCNVYDKDYFMESQYPIYVLFLRMKLRHMKVNKTIYYVNEMLCSASACPFSNFLITGISGGSVGRSRTNPPNDKDFRNFDYESDFETDEEVGSKRKHEASAACYMCCVACGLWQWSEIDNINR